MNRLIGGGGGNDEESRVDGCLEHTQPPQAPSTLSSLQSPLSIRQATKPTQHRLQLQTRPKQPLSRRLLFLPAAPRRKWKVATKCSTLWGGGTREAPCSCLSRGGWPGPGWPLPWERNSHPAALGCVIGRRTRGPLSRAHFGSAIPAQHSSVRAGAGATTTHAQLLPCPSGQQCPMRSCSKSGLISIPEPWRPHLAWQGKHRESLSLNTEQKQAHLKGSGGGHMGGARALLCKN